MCDGRLNYCKECKKAEIKHNRSLKRGRYAAYERKRNQTEKRKAYHAANVSSWRENPPKMAVQLARHRVRKLNAEGDFTGEEFEALCEKHDDVCLRCGEGDVLLMPDHVVPLSVGGSNRITNIQPLCGSCNSWKNIKAVDYRLNKTLSPVLYQHGRPSSRKRSKKKVC